MIVRKKVRSGLQELTVVGLNRFGGRRRKYFPRRLAQYLGAWQAP